MDKTASGAGSGPQPKQGPATPEGAPPPKATGAAQAAPMPVSGGVAVAAAAMPAGRGPAGAPPGAVGGAGAPAAKQPAAMAAGQPMQAGMGMPMPIEVTPIRWGALWRWALYVAGMAPLLVASEVVVTIVVTLLAQYNGQVFATVIAGLTRSADAAPAAPPSGLLGLIAPLLPHDPTPAVIVYAVVTLALIALGYGNRVLAAWVDNRMIGRLRQSIHDKILALGPSTQGKFEGGRAMMLITAFVNVAQMILKEAVTAPLIRLVTLAGALFFLVGNMQTLGQQDNWIQAILLVALIALPVLGWHLAAKLPMAFARVRVDQEQMTEEFMNSVHQPGEVQLMGAEPQRAAAFAKRVRELVRAQVAATIRHELAIDFQAAMPNIILVVVLLYGVLIASHSGNPEAVGAIVALSVFVPQAVAPIQDFLQVVAGFKSSWPQVEAVIDVLEAEPEGGPDTGTLDLQPSDRSITFRDVTFAYAPDHPKVVDGVSHAFAPGKVTAIVARFGTGKSTVLNLIAGLRHPQQGEILIGDKDLRQIKHRSLRENVVKVSQYPLLISDTARENFRLAKADVTDAEIEAVCHRTGLWEILAKETPPGGDPLSYPVSREEGIGLSGGQRRIFAVTRALLLKPNVLLLDEPTTGIDPIGRHEVYETLARACAGLTVVAVDQDTNFISHFADQICCLEHGKFSDVGSPAELLARPSLFAQLTEASTQ